MDDLNSNIEGLEDLNLDNLKPNYNIWATNWGEFLELSEIKDGHLINIIKMLYNNIVSPQNPLSDDYVRWSFSYLDKNDAIEYIEKMFEELDSRGITEHNDLKNRIFPV